MTMRRLCKNHVSWQKPILMWIILLFHQRIGGAASFLASAFHCMSSVCSCPQRRSCSVVSTSARTSCSFITTLQLTRTSTTTISSSGSTVDHHHQEKKHTLSHADIVWKLKPPPTQQDDDDQDKKERQHHKKEWKLGDFKISKPLTEDTTDGDDDDDDDDASFRLWLSTVRAAVALVSAGQRQVVLEAWVKEEEDEDSSEQQGENKQNINNGRLTKQAGRFGITVQAGPPHPLIQSTVQDLFFGGSSIPSSRTACAIIYMFVEPAFRGRNLGTLALQVIAFLHGSVADCDYTLLVADDKSDNDGSSDDSSSHQHQRLVAWYERNGGFVRAPALQELMGSPNQIHGISMIGPTTKSIQGQKEAPAPAAYYPPEDCTIEWYFDPDILSS